MFDLSIMFKLNFGFTNTGVYGIMGGMARGKTKMLTVKEVAARLGATDGAVRAWCIAGRFPGADKQQSPIGEFWLIPESALAQFSIRKSGPKPKTKAPISDTPKRRRGRPPKPAKASRNDG
jgi:hypothetical protein